MSTKSESFQKVSATKAKTTAQIKLAIATLGKATRAEIANATGLKLSSVCGRINEMKEVGMIVVTGKKFDLETERNVEVVELRS